MIMPNKLLLFLPLIFFVKVSAQQPLNLGFEELSVEGTSRPWGWSQITWGTPSFGLDSVVTKSGKYSLKFHVADSTTSSAVHSLRYDIETYALKNSYIVVEGFIKTQFRSESVSVSIGYSYLDSANNYALKDTSSVPISGIPSWTKCSLRFFIPEHAIGAFIQLNFSGFGSAWFDAFNLFAGGRMLAEVPTGVALSKKELNKLSKQTAVMDSIRYTDPKRMAADLALFKQTVGKSELIALGEATHGTSEFFTLKQTLFQYAVTELGFRVFALEDNQLSVEKVNKYVHSGHGSAIESMSGLFDVWYREEMVKLVEWVRDFNQQHPDDLVSFVGFDMQDISIPVDSLQSFLSVWNPDLFLNYRTELEGIKKEGKRSYALSDSTKLKWSRCFNDLFSQVSNQKAEWLKKSQNLQDSLTILHGIQYAQLVQQFAENLYLGHWSLYRDKAMAENIIWLKEERFPQSKMVIWAHDVHISKGEHPNELYNLNSGISMGSFLSKKYRQNYTSFSLSTYEGSYTALKSYTNYEKVLCPLYPSPIGSVDYTLHQIARNKNCNILFLPLAKKDPWLSKPLPKRFANHVSIDYGFWEKTSLPYQFDGVFFIDKTNGSTRIEE